MAHDVFISYSSKDKPVADGACATLEAKGMRKWTAEKVTLNGGTMQANGVGFATDIFVNAALKGDRVTGCFEVNDLGQYRAISAAEDEGAVSATADTITFTSDTTHETRMMGYYHFNAMMAQAMVSTNGGKPGDEGLWLNPQLPLMPAGLVGKPLNKIGSALDRIAGDWWFKGQVNGAVATPHVQLSIGADGRYRFRGELDEQGMFTSGDGKWSRAPQGAPQPITGTYVFDGRDRVTTAASNGTTIWKRAE